MPALPNVTHAVLYSGVVQEVNTSGYACFLLKGAQCFSRLDHTTQGLIPHTKGSSYAPTTALSAGYLWLKLIFLFFGQF